MASHEAQSRLLNFVCIEPFHQLWTKHGLTEDDMIGLENEMIEGVGEGEARGMASSNPRTPRIRRRAKQLRNEEGLSPLIADACAGIDELLDAAEAGESLDGLCSIRTRRLELKPREYGPEQVRAVRAKLNASQALLARFLGITTETVSSWEQGRRKVPPMARRYLDDLIDVPALWETRTGMAVREK
jgi:DNA-binding transcriptional regulator YiaG